MGTIIGQGTGITEAAYKISNDSFKTENVK
jgi:hypothetical protein